MLKHKLQINQRNPNHPFIVHHFPPLLPPVRPRHISTIAAAAANLTPASPSSSNPTSAVSCCGASSSPSAKAANARKFGFPFFKLSIATFAPCVECIFASDRAATNCRRVVRSCSAAGVFAGSCSPSTSAFAAKSDGNSGQIAIAFHWSSANFEIASDAIISCAPHPPAAPSPP